MTQLSLLAGRTVDALQQYCWYPPEPLLFAYTNYNLILLDFSLTIKAATLTFISGHGSAISSAKEGKSGFIYNLVKI